MSHNRLETYKHLILKNHLTSFSVVEQKKSKTSSLTFYHILIKYQDIYAGQNQKILDWGKTAFITDLNDRS